MMLSATWNQNGSFLKFKGKTMKRPMIEKLEQLAAQKKVKLAPLSMGRQRLFWAKNRKGFVLNGGGFAP